MNSFVQKKLASAKSLPEIIKEQRQIKELSQEELADKSQISLKYLKALEAGDYNMLPGDIYTKQFLKKIAKEINLNEKKIQNIYQQEKNKQLSLLKFNQTKSTKNYLESKNWLSPKFLRNVLISLVILSFLGYFGWEIKNIFTPPELTIVYPDSQTITTEATIEISGITDPETTVRINQQEILTELEGDFSQTVDLKIGLNVFTITAEKKHSKTSLETISILRKPTETAEINQQNFQPTFSHSGSFNNY